MEIIDANRRVEKCSVVEIEGVSDYHGSKEAWRAESCYHVHGAHGRNQDGHDDGGGSYAQHAVLHAVPHNQHDDGQRPQKGGGDAHDRQVHRHQRHDDSNSHQKAAFRS